VAYVSVPPITATCLVVEYAPTVPNTAI
jgi:hypothetical protein